MMVRRSPQMMLIDIPDKNTNNKITDPVTSSVLHPGGSVLATCSGQKQFPDYAMIDEDGHLPENPTIDNSLKIWSL